MVLCCHTWSMWTYFYHFITFIFKFFGDDFCFFCYSENIFLPLSFLVVGKYIFYLWLSQWLDLCIQKHCSLGIEFNYWNRKSSRLGLTVLMKQKVRTLWTCAAAPQGPPYFRLLLSLCFVILSISFHPTKPSMSQRMVISSTSQPHSKWKEKRGKDQGKEEEEEKTEKEHTGRKRHCLYLCRETRPEPQSTLPSVSLPRTLSHATSLCKEARKEGFYLGTLSVWTKLGFP